MAATFKFKTKLEFIRNMAQYAMDHYQIINEKLADDVMEKFGVLLNDVCTNHCNGTFDCKKDYCPVYFFLDDIKALTKDECEKS